MTKLCSKCNVEKNISEFNKKASSKDGLQVRCRACTKLVYKEYYANNADKCAAKNKRHIHTARKWLVKYKNTVKCASCPEDHPACLQFHHRDPSTKLFAISELTNVRPSVAKLKAEIAKCDVLCANCHQKLHWRERQKKALDDLEAESN